MNVRRNWSFFLLMLLFCVCATLLLAEEPIMQSWRVLRGVPESGDWQIVGVGAKVSAAATWRDGAPVLRYFTTDGTMLSERQGTADETMDGAVIARFLPVREGLAYLGVYGPNAEKLYLYRLGEDGQSERLLALSCAGGSFSERSGHTSFSEFSYEDGVLYFAVRRRGALTCYLCREGGNVEETGKAVCDADSVHTVLTAQNGSVLLGGRGYLAFAGAHSGAPVGGQTVTRLTPGRGGWYYIDAARMDMCFVDAAFGASQRMLRLNTVWDGEARELTDLALTRDESALMLLDGSILTVTDAEGTRELSGILRPTPLRAGLTLAKYGMIALIAATVLWLLLCGIHRGYASIVVLRGGFLASAVLLCFTLLYYGVLASALDVADVRENSAVAAGILRAARVDSRMSDESLRAELCRMLESTENGRNVRVVLAGASEEGYVTADGCLALAEEGFSPALADEALRSGEACTLHSGVFRYARAAGTRVLLLRVENAHQTDDEELLHPLLTICGLLVLLAMLTLLTIGMDVRRISERMELISRGSVPERLNLRTGDELESMASVVNSLAVSLRGQEEERASLERSYRRFVPEKVLALLGKQTVAEVDKSTFAARRMAVMTVWFSFPETLYTDIKNSRLLFDSVNEVIERTASIVARKGGTVFHFAYNGFDVVMDEDGEAVSTAVAIRQEALSFNELRAQKSLPPVTLRIALDVGDVMLGIVGDTTQMEPTTISSSLSTVQELMGLCGRLKAGILCTETIAAQRQEYGSRYMGKCVVGGRPVRVYEVFDGDEFNVRRGKASSMRDFSQGVYDLYGGDAAGAKHKFLQLAHSYPLDGGVRYYLYLADRLEHDPSLPCVLNMDSVGGGGM